MLNRFVIPAVATLLALGLLWVVLQVKPQASGPTTVTVKPPTDLEMKLNPQAEGNLGPRSQIVDKTALTSISTVNERGTLIQFSYQTLDLLPQGVSDVKSPTARIHLKRDQRVLQIQSQQGRLVAPERHPRSGTLSGEVTVCLFDAPEGQAVNLASDSPHLRLRMDLDEAQFDLELGTIDSEGLVKVNGPRVDFQGTGLSLSYNELKKRVDRLEIDRGKYLRIKPAPTKEQAPPRKADARPATQPKQHAKPAAESADPRQPQFYRATFQKNVHVQTTDAVIDCDTLAAQFSVAQRRDSDQVIGELGQLRPTPANHARASGTRLTMTPAGVTTRLAPLALHLAALVPAATDGGGVPAGLGRDELLITWTGRLVLEPLENKPAELVDEDDSMVELVGRPLSVTTRNGELLQGARLLYTQSSSLLTVYASDAHPLTLDSPRLGTMHGTKLLANLRDATATVHGPGHLRGHGSSVLTPAASTPALGPEADAATAALPRGTAIFWDDRLELAFVPHEKSAKNKPQHGQEDPDALVRGLRSAEVLGDVQVTDPGFELRGDRLTLGLAPQDGRQTLQQIEVQGHVQARTKSLEPREQLEVESNTVTLEFEPDAVGKPRPTKLVCTEEVRATLQGDQRMRAAMMEVTFAGAPLVSVPNRLPPELAAAGATVAPAGQAMTQLLDPQGAARPLVPRLNRAAPGGDADHDDRARVRRLVAQHDLEIEITDPKSPPVRVVGDRLVADVENKQVHIFGLPDQRVRVVREDGELIGDHLLLQTESKVMHVLGPGVFNVQLRRKADEPAAAEAAKARDPIDKDTGELSVQWSQRMSFDYIAGLAQFTGSVVAEATKQESQSILTADELRLDLADVQATPAKPKPDVQGDRGALGLKGGTRELRTVQAAGNVVFQGEKLAKIGDTTPEHRLRLEGPLLTFDNVQEKMTVEGVGRMLFEDYKPRRQPEGSITDNPMMQMSGQGVTLFTWKGQLIMDAARNDMILEREVQMLHSPQDTRRKPVQLDCHRFVADLESTGGLNSWFSGAGNQPRLTAATAERSVRIRSGDHTVLTDTMIFTGADEVVTLRARDGGYTTVQEAGKPASPAAREVKWDLKTGELTIEKPGSIVVPVER